MNGTQLLKAHNLCKFVRRCNKLQRNRLTNNVFTYSVHLSVSFLKIFYLSPALFSPCSLPVSDLPNEVKREGTLHNRERIATLGGLKDIP